MTTGSAADADTLPGAARLGQTVAGKYRLERLLGRGGMGEVYEARHVVVGRRFAIKFLHPHLAQGKQSSARFLREAQAAGALDNEHIAAVLDFDADDDGTPFLVMEYLSGESVARLLAREGPLPVPRVVGILLDVCEGLAAAHAAGIVHRDLKPDNLFVVHRADGSQLVKIVDFGIAKLVWDASTMDATQSGAVLGTPFYMAPEQARGQRSVDFRVDIHALGVIAYELLSGYKPHPGSGYNAILAHILTEPVTPLSELRAGLPPGLSEVIERAMAFEPAVRHGSVAELSRDLGRFAGPELTPRGAQLELRATARVLHGDVASSGESTLATGQGAPLTPSEGTLQSAVGDVRSVTPPTRDRRVFYALGLGLAALSLIWLIAARRDSPSTPAAAAREAAASPREEARRNTGSAPSASPLPGSLVLHAGGAAPIGSPGSPPPERTTRRARPAAISSPAPVRAARSKLDGESGTQSRPAHEPPEVGFDEKNPY